MTDECSSDMKQSSNISIKQTGNLAQYSSGEDDSGTEDVYTKQDAHFRSCLNRPIDLKLKKTLLQPSVKQNKFRTGMIHNSTVNTFSSTLNECSTARKSHRRLISSIFLPNSLNSKQSVHKSVVWNRSPVVRARLWSEHDRDTELSGSVTSSVKTRGSHILYKSQHEHSRNILNAERIPLVKKPDNCRKVLSDITKETVPDFRFQIPSYFSRDVLPLDSEDNAKVADNFSMKNIKIDNNNFVKDECSYSEPTVNGILPRTRHRAFQNSVDVSKEFKTTEEKGWFSLHYQKVSMILVIFVLLFFVGVGLLYLNVRYKDTIGNISDKKGNAYPVCEPGSHKDACIEKGELNAIIGILQIITPQLLTVARNALCNSSENISVSMSDDDILDFIINHSSYDSMDDAQNVLKNLKLLVNYNPHWDVSVLQENQNDSHGDSKIDSLNSGQLVFKNPLLPIGCQLRLWFSSVLAWISSITAVFVAVSGVLFGFWDYRRRYQQHRQEVYMFVNKIISAVRNHHQRIETSGINAIPYLSVDVCRKEIFSTKPAQSISSAWEDAVKFIDVHESRILTDVLDIHGKPTKVWQWSCTSSPQAVSTSPKPCRDLEDGNSRSNSTCRDSRNLSVAPVVPTTSGSPRNKKSRRNKVWQGQAFETIAGSPNSLPCSPTPCLKIRHMFDPDLEHGDDWPVLIQDSILEKCENVCVLHLFVDCSSQEGCVFMKCSSPEEAGKAYRALHGWWFDTKLVTVKYLRIERYHERFPEAANVSSPLRPSNNQRLSLQELWHFPIEST